MTDAPSAEAAPALATEQEASRAQDAKHRPASTLGEKRGSCAPCRRAHAGCDGMRPCRRCISSHQEANCADQVPGSAPPRAPRATPTVQPTPQRGEGEGGPCTDCQFGSRSNVHCPFNRCRKCCIIAHNDCAVHRDGVSGLSLRPRSAPALAPTSPSHPSSSSRSSAPSHASSAASGSPISGAAAAAALLASQSGVPLAQAYAPPVKEQTQNSGPPVPFRLAPARVLCDQFIYNPDPSMIRPATSPAYQSVVVTCPSCNREVSRLGDALWAHMAHCNPELFAAYIAGSLEEIPTASPAPLSAAEAARQAATERLERHTALLNELFSAQPSLEVMGMAEELAQTANREERSAAMQRVIDSMERVGTLRPGVAARAQHATRKRDQFWQAYEEIPSLAPAALAAAAQRVPSPPPPSPTPRAQRVVSTPTAKRKRDDNAVLLQL